MTTPSQAGRLGSEQRRTLQHALDRLAEEFSGVFGRETVQRFMDESLADLEGARVQTFVPLLVERFTRDRLRALARVEGRKTAEVPTVLFLCVHNAGRSQMAAGWLDHLAQGRVQVLSAGSEPADQINPKAVEAMAEVGIDIRRQFPKPWKDELVRAADVVVTMGCGDVCPVYPGKRYEDWDLADPHGAELETVREVRDEIHRRVCALMADLGVEPAA